jgi:hypothetical protein
MKKGTSESGTQATRFEVGRDYRVTRIGGRNAFRIHVTSMQNSRTGLYLDASRIRSDGSLFDHGRPYAVDGLSSIVEIPSPA